MTIDEELTHLDSLLRRLKIEYEVYFNNPTKRPPTDLEWKTVALIRKHSDGGRMNFTQRFRYNEMAQRYAIYSDLWRKKMRIREEGYRRPQDALLSVQGVRSVDDPLPKAHTTYGIGSPRSFTMECSEAAPKEDVERLYNALIAAKKKSGEPVSGDLNSFSAFVKKKTDQIRKQYSCEKVEYSVELHDGQVKLKAKAKT
ncbi:MAG TPA: MXAN_5187 C-terminal domain-containing protein [Terriglobales bacterium]|nr:MXAN_5187 C-terminal domain-containing protein [Terriglobales bacterium]